MRCGKELKDLYGSGLFCNKSCRSRANGAKKCRRASQAQSSGEVGDGCGDVSGGGYLEMAYKEMAVVEDEIASGKRK